jgi:hypothetical protein
MCPGVSFAPIRSRRLCPRNLDNDPTPPSERLGKLEVSCRFVGKNGEMLCGRLVVVAEDCC